MINTEIPPKILFIDPINSTYYYNFCFVDSIGKLYPCFTFLTSDFIYDRTLKTPRSTEFRFFLFTTSIAKRIHVPAILRRILRGIEYPINLFILLITLKSRGIKIIHYNMFVMPLFEILFLKVCRSFGIKIVITAHNPLPHDTEKKHKKNYQKLYNSADLIITLTNYVKSEIQQGFLVSNKKIKVIPHGDMFYIFDQVKYIKPKVYEAPTIAFIGSISPYKGLMFLLDVFKLILQQMETRLLIKGLANESMAKYYEQAKKLEINEKIIWEIGYSVLEDMYKKIGNIKLFVFPYRTASQSGGIITAFTLFKPVIVRPVGGLTEMILENKDGLVATERQEMADKIVELLSDKRRYDEMVLNIKTQRKKQNDWAAICNQFIGEYFNLFK